MLIGPLATNFNEIYIEIHPYPLKNICFKMSSGEWRPIRFGLDVLTIEIYFDLSTDVLALLGVNPSAGRLLTTNIDMSFKINSLLPKIWRDVV